jgi:hypothetical protein
VHKLRGRFHDAAADSFAGVRVNEPVPLGADGDAARLSRPAGDPTQTVANHQSPRRLSVLTGDTTVADQRDMSEAAAIRALVTVDDPEAAHRAWLDTWVASQYNEALYHPYTSLKYHTLLTAALLSNYRAGATFADLWLAVDDPGCEPTPHRTILQTERLSLRITATPGDRPAARLGAAPARSFADVWSRLPAGPLPVDASRQARLLDAQLRRIRSWSVALQYIEEYQQVARMLGGAR